MAKTEGIQRLSLYERAVSGLVALSFVRRPVIGLAIVSPFLSRLDGFFAAVETFWGWRPWGNSGLSEVESFNTCQQTLLGIQSLGASVLFASGIFLWSSEPLPDGLRLTASVFCPTAVTVSMGGGIIVLIYMVTAASPGAFRSTIRGRVSSR